MKIIKSIFLLIMLSGLSTHAIAQFGKTKKFYNLTEFGYLTGIGSYKIDGTKVSNNGHAYRLRTQFGSFITPKLSLGIGIGLDGYHQPSYNTCPTFVDVHYYLNDQKKTMFIFGDFGYAIELGPEFSGGPMMNSGIGYKRTMNKSSLLFSLGYNIQQIRNVSFTIIDVGTGQFHTTQNHIGLKSISFNFGILF